MRVKVTHKPGVSALALLGAAAAALAGCGGHVGDKQAAMPTKVAITATEAGKQTRLSVPKSVPAGLVTLKLTNIGKAFREAQIIRLEPGHTPGDALKVIAAEGRPAPVGFTQPAAPAPHRRVARARRHSGCGRATTSSMTPRSRTRVRA